MGHFAINSHYVYSVVLIDDSLDVFVMSLNVKGVSGRDVVEVVELILFDSPDHYSIWWQSVNVLENVVSVAVSQLNIRFVKQWFQIVDAVVGAVAIDMVNVHITSYKTVIAFVGEPVDEIVLLSFVAGNSE